MWILIALFILLFFVLFVSMPLIVEARARLSVRGAVIRGSIWILGLIPIPIRMRLNLFTPPRFTLRIGRKRTIPLLQKHAGKAALPKAGIRILRLDTVTTVGITEDPFRAVLVAGSAAVLLSMATTRIAERGFANARFCEHGMFRIAVKTQAVVEPVKLLSEAVRQRIRRGKAANTIRKTNEKRTTYASG